MRTGAKKVAQILCGHTGGRKLCNIRRLRPLHYRSCVCTAHLCGAPFVSTKRPLDPHCRHGAPKPVAKGSIESKKLMVLCGCCAQAHRNPT